MIKLSQGNVKLFGGIYEGKKVLITGHTGFKGSWIALWLHSLGASVIGYALEPPTQPSLFKALELDDAIESIVGDVRDFDRLLNTLNRYRPEIVFHLAAQPLVRYSYAEPRITFDTNVMGTVNVLEAVRRSPDARVAVNITSDKCYENRAYDYVYSESDPMGGYDPYSSSKGCAELVTSAYRRSFFGEETGVRLASVRAGNVVGGGDWAADRLVPDCVKALSRNESILVRNPEAMRPWQHVLEPLSGYLWLASLMFQGGKEYDGAWNFGPEDSNAVSVGEIVEIVIREWGHGCWYTAGGNNQLHEAKLLRLDCSKAKDYLNWHSVYGIEETLKATISWYKAYSMDQKIIRQHTLNGLVNYIKTAKSQGLAWAGETSTPSASRLANNTYM